MDATQKYSAIESYGYIFSLFWLSTFWCVARFYRQDPCFCLYFFVYFIQHMVEN